MIVIYFLALRLHVMKLCKLTKKSLNRYPYWQTYFINID